MASNCAFFMFFFNFPSACVLMLISFWPIMSRACQLIKDLHVFTWEDPVTKEMSVIYEPAHIAAGLQLLEMS